MKVSEIKEKLGYELVNMGEDREIEGIFCGDLLSLVMGRAKSSDAWITVIGNVNCAAVAVLTDVSCIILSEGTNADEALTKRAVTEGITIFKTDDSSATAVIKLNSLLQQ
ncbi:MAG: hypothetical protein E7480_04850 [Ruminococcaceae bacterium]|nr:hypothetical protein [Oscillospiraceae bacterium]